jgi:hypothetical protein
MIIVSRRTIEASLCAPQLATAANFSDNICACNRAKQGLTIGYAEVSGENVQIKAAEGEGITKLADAEVKLR